MDILNKAKRVNQAYEESYGPNNLLNAPITRDLAANRVIERRSAFPALATADYFNSALYNTQRKNISLTRGIDLRGKESFRAKGQPGQIAYQSSFGLELDESDSPSHNIWMYAVGIILAIAVITILF